MISRMCLTRKAFHDFLPGGHHVVFWGLHLEAANALLEPEAWALKRTMKSLT